MVWDQEPTDLSPLPASFKARVAWKMRRTGSCCCNLRGKSLSMNALSKLYQNSLTPRTAGASVRLIFQGSRSFCCKTRRAIIQATTRALHPLMVLIFAFAACFAAYLQVTRRNFSGTVTGSSRGDSERPGAGEVLNTKISGIKFRADFFNARNHPNLPGNECDLSTFGGDHVF